MALCASASGLATGDGQVQNAPFRATQLWREIITSFRSGMPRRKKRVKIRVYEECFSGHDAVEWLHFHLQTSGNFGNVSRQQVLRLLQKFLDSDVIRDVRGKVTRFDAEGSTLYCFVTEPGALNFVEDMETSGCHTPSRSPSRPRSPLGKHTRPDGKQASMESEDTLFTNEYAFMSNDSMSEMETSMCSRDETFISSRIQTGGGGSESDGGLPVKKCRSDSLMVTSCHVKIHREEEESVSNRDNFCEISKSNSTSQLVQLTPAQVAGVWKDLTLNHLLQLVELETLEGVLAYDAVDGKHIAGNVGTLVTSRTRTSLATPTRLAVPTAGGNKGSTSSLPSAVGGCGQGRTKNGNTTNAGGGVGSSHPHWLNRRFGTRLSRVQPSQKSQPPPSPLLPPASNVHTSLCRSKSARKHTSSALTLHHKLRYSIKHGETFGSLSNIPPSSRSSGTTIAATASCTITASRSSNCISSSGARGGEEGVGGRARESVMDVPHWVVLAMKCLAKWPDGCTEEFVGGMPIYCGFEFDVLQSIVQYFNSLSDPLISPKLYDLHMAVLRLVKEEKPSAIDALQLCSLLLPQTNRTRLHRVLRLIHKASSNRQLVLSKTKTNREVLLEHFSTIVFKSSSHSVSPLHMPLFGKAEPVASGGCGPEEEKEGLKRLVSFMAHHYQQIFKIPDNLRKEVKRHLEMLSAGKDGQLVHETRTFCHRVSSAEYEHQKQQCVTDSLVALLDNILDDTSMSAKVKKQRLKQFQKAYPEIYASRVTGGATQEETTPYNLRRNSVPNLGMVVTSSASTCSEGSGSRPAKGRPLSKLATNYYSTDCLATSKPVLR